MQPQIFFISTFLIWLRGENPTGVRPVVRYASKVQFCFHLRHATLSPRLKMIDARKLYFFCCACVFLWRGFCAMLIKMLTNKSCLQSSEYSFVFGVRTVWRTNDLGSLENILVQFEHKVSINSNSKREDGLGNRFIVATQYRSTWTFGYESRGWI